jgi:hypothetical protein
LPEQRHSVVHIIVVVQVVPIECIGVIVVIFIFIFVVGLVEMVQDSVDHPADGAGVLTDFLKGLDRLFIFKWVFFWCHFEMITQKEYLRIAVIGNNGSKGYVEMDGTGMGRAFTSALPVFACLIYGQAATTLISEANRFSWVSGSMGSCRRYFVNWETISPAAIFAQ